MRSTPPSPSSEANPTNGKSTQKLPPSSSKGTNTSASKSASSTGSPTPLPPVSASVHSSVHLLNAPILPTGPVGGGTPSTTSDQAQTQHRVNVIGSGGPSDHITSNVSAAKPHHVRKGSHKSITCSSLGSTDEHEHPLDKSDRSLTSVSVSVSTASRSRRRQSFSKRPTNVQSSSGNVPSYAYPPPILIPQHLVSTAMNNSSASIHSHNNGNISDSNVKNETIGSTAAAPISPTSKALDSNSINSFHYPQQHQKPKPRRPISSCPLLCVFYAEFDNIVGPKICYQSPQKFMDSNIEITMEEIDEILKDTFDDEDGKNSNDENDADDVSTDTPNQEMHNDISSRDVVDHMQSPSSQQLHHNHHHHHQQQQTFYSIFDSTSEYIVTGHEMLAGKIISLSTHNMHIISFPLIIQNTKRYERNSLLFSVGFVIRRSSDPSPFRPLLSKLASTFQSMELESAFLSSEKSRRRLQDILDGVLLSLNSPSSECHLLLDDANILHLQYFPPPKVQGPPVPDYVVPVLLKPESELQSLDWDLTINWIVPHINGIKYVKHIAESSKVDPEMVRASLRVLRQYHAVACVDMFRYDNIYECTEKAQRMLAGDEDLDGLLVDAYNFALRQSPSYPTPDGNVSGSSTRGSHSLGGGSNTPTSVAVGGGGGMSHQNSPHLSSLGGNNGPLNNSPSGLEHFASPSAYSPTNTPSTPTLIHPPLSSSTNTAPLHPSSMNKKKEPRYMMKALAILYNSCQKNLTVEDMWADKLFGNHRSNKESDDQSSVTNGRNQVLDTEKKRPEYRSSSLGSISSLGRTKVEDIDWKEVFDTFDHRRFVTFGVIHGLIQRLHEYPIAYGVTTDDTDSSADDTDDDGSASFTTNEETFYTNGDVKRRLVGKDSVESKTTNYTFRFSPTLQAQQAPSIPALPSINFSHLPSTTSLSGRNKEEFKEKNDHKLALKIASLMDGERCDDELSCIFQRPFSELKDLVKQKTGKEVLSIFQRRR